MYLEKIITLANEKTRLRFIAMERSLRACGCHLPLWVIPYDNNKFELPANAQWWEMPEIIDWLNSNKTHKTMRKYQCLTEKNYQFVDTDVVFLKNPEKVLEPLNGFITSCGHWHDQGHTVTKEVLSYFSKTSTIWQQYVFNSGQFACDRILYNFNELKQKAEQTGFKPTCVDFRFHEQPGLNLLVNASGVPVTNLTLQPHYMQSTWAGDYVDSGYERFWKDENRKPYLIHWAGCNNSSGSPIDKLFFDYLTISEKAEWNERKSIIEAQKKSFSNQIKDQLKKIKSIIKR
jgi:hypothetical protein